MKNEENKMDPSPAGKARPENVSGRNEEQAKAKTKPLDEGNDQRRDQQEGDMDNGEMGADLKN